MGRNWRVQGDCSAKAHLLLSWLKRLGLAGLVLGSIALLMGQAKPEQSTKVVEAEKFILRDARGTVRAELGFNDKAPSLVMFDAGGKRRTQLAVLADGSASLSVLDEEGNSRAVLHVGPDGEPDFRLYDKQGRVRFAVSDRAATLPSNSPIRPVVGPAASTETNERLQRAAGLYRKLCASCHGTDGRGTRLRASPSAIPDFTAAAWHDSRSDAQLVANILNGRGVEMPPFDDQVSAEQARDLVAYIRAWGPARVRQVETGANDFDRQIQQLQRQWDELQKQVQELRKP